MLVHFSTRTDLMVTIETDKQTRLVVTVEHLLNTLFVFFSEVLVSFLRKKKSFISAELLRSIEIRQKKKNK